MNILLNIYLIVCYYVSRIVSQTSNQFFKISMVSDIYINLIRFYLETFFKVLFKNILLQC